MSQSYINVIGAGLAGSEAAYQIAERGIPVKLYEMRGVKSTPQHKTDNFAELVCSNSLRGDALTNAVGLLKEEMRRLGSVILEIQHTCFWERTWNRASLFFLKL
ncbi:tRNA (uracil-5-)-methyltransferase Gid [Streptococcus pneumoniae]|nr:tRNA (uracil-5-)-methyltransferase Gid [Streptococcus pneumoniae]